MHVKRRLPDEVLDDTVPADVPPATDLLAAGLAAVDQSLTTMAYRQLVTSSEVSDLLLDLRGVLLVAELEAISRVASTAA